MRENDIGCFVKQILSHASKLENSREKVIVIFLIGFASKPTG